MKRAVARRWRLAELALGITATVLALAAAEIAARVLSLAGPPIRFGQLGEMVRWQGVGTVLDQSLRDDPELFWRLAENVTLPDEPGPLRGLISNAQGLREDREIPLVKPPGEIRILFLGDSTTFGWRVRHDETFVRLTEQELRRRFPGTEVVCINAGVPAYTLFQGWRFLETRGFRYKPDLVVLTFGFNDPVRWDGWTDREHHAVWRSSQPIPLLRWSRLAHLAWRGVARLRRPAPETPQQVRVPPKEFRRLLEATHDAVRQRGVDLLVLVGAWLVNVGPPPQNQLSRYQIEQFEFGFGVPFGPDRTPAFVDGVAIVRRLAEEHPAANIFSDWVHPTPLANRATAQALADKIAPWLAARVER